MFKTFLITWEQNGPVEFKKHTIHKTQYVLYDDILCQWDFNEQTEKLVRLLFCNSKNCSRKFHAWV